MWTNKQEKTHSALVGRNVFAITIIIRNFYLNLIKPQLYWGLV